MTLTYNDVTYTVSEESIYRDMSIEVGTLQEACALVEALEGMTAYTFTNKDYSNMIVLKRSIILDGTITVNIKLRQKSEKETMREEIESLRTAMEELALTTNKTTTAKINKILSKGVS